jgi:hypothetical protein
MSSVTRTVETNVLWKAKEFFLQIKNSNEHDVFAFDMLIVLGVRYSLSLVATSANSLKHWAGRTEGE